MEPRSLFGDRHSAGEHLAFALREPALDAVLGASWGALEVGYPIAVLGGAELRYLPAGERPELDDLAGCRVVLADDARTPLPDLADLLTRLAGAGAAHLVLAIPWLPGSVAADLLPGGAHLVSLCDGPLPLPLYDRGERPDVAGAVERLQRAARGRHRSFAAGLWAACRDVRHPTMGCATASSG